MPFSDHARCQTAFSTAPLFGLGASYETICIIFMGLNRPS